jgi:hypothetical protein
MAIVSPDFMALRAPSATLTRPATRAPMVVKKRVEGLVIGLT